MSFLFLEEFISLDLKNKYFIEGIEVLNKVCSTLLMLGVNEEEAVGKKVKIKNMISGSEFIIDYKELFKGKI